MIDFAPVLPEIFKISYNKQKMEEYTVGFDVPTHLGDQGALEFTVLYNGGLRDSRPDDFISLF
jgi:hypothetical protein